MTVRLRTFSQAPQAVRSASGRRWDWALSAGAPADSTLQTDKGNAFGLTVQVHGLCSISSTAATRAVVRIHSSPLGIASIVHDTATVFLTDRFALRIANKISQAAVLFNRAMSREGVQADGDALSECANYLLFQRVVLES